MNVPFCSISKHAVARFVERVDNRLSRGVARVALFRMYQCSVLATDWQLKRFGVRAEYDSTYRISDTSYGRYLLAIKCGVIVTIWSLRIDE